MKDSAGILVSVIVPVYNVEIYLERCVNSIIKQTYHNLDIILVDDGSKDSSGMLCEQFKQQDERIRVIHKKNEGLGYARNTGIENAHGEYVCFVDSDDYIDNILIEECVASLIENDYPDMIVYGLRNLGNSGETISEVKCIEKTVYKDNDVLEKFIPDMLGHNPDTNMGTGLWMSACTALFSLDLMSKNRLRFVSEREYIAEDTYSLLKFYSYMRKVVLLPGVYYNYCLNEQSLTHSFREDRIEKILLFYHAMMKLCRDLKLGNTVKERINYPTFSYLISALKILSKNCSFKETKTVIDKAMAFKDLNKVCTFIMHSNYSATWRILSFNLLNNTLLASVLLKLKNYVEKIK